MAFSFQTTGGNNHDRTKRINHHQRIIPKTKGAGFMDLQQEPGERRRHDTTDEGWEAPAFQLR